MVAHQGAHFPHRLRYTNALPGFAWEIEDLATNISIYPRILVNSVSWAPHELGAMLACASSDGRVSVLFFNGKDSVY